jgi:hypothetical protein
MTSEEELKARIAARRSTGSAMSVPRLQPHPGKHCLASGIFPLRPLRARPSAPRDQAFPGQLALQVEVATQAAGAYRQDDVIDRGAVGEAADGLEIPSGKRRVSNTRCGETSLLKRVIGKLLRAAEEFSGKGARRGLDRGPAARQGLAMRKGKVATLNRRAAAGRHCPAPLRGTRVRAVPAAANRPRCRAAGGDLVAAIDIDRGMVDLQQHGKAADRQVEKAVESLDHVHLPQRALQVERPGVDARGLDAELAPVAGLGQGDVAHVVFDVEALVLDPVRDSRGRAARAGSSRGTPAAGRGGFRHGPGSA